MQYNLPDDPKTATNRVCKVRDIVTTQQRSLKIGQYSTKF